MPKMRTPNRPMTATALVCAVLGLVLLDARAVVLENADLAVEIDDATYAVRSVANRKAGGAKFVDATADAALWTAEFRKGPADPRPVRLTSNSPCRAKRVERNADGGATFVWEGLDVGEEKAAATVRARVALTAEGTSEWTLEVRNTGCAYGLFSTRYPIFGRVAAAGEADLLLPRQDVGARLVREARLEHDRNFGCMGYHPVMTALFRGRAGLYFAAHDSQARIKSLTVAKDLSVSFATPVENAGLPGKAAEGPRYAVTVAALEGDWWAAAKLYRRWALTTPWTAKGPIAARADYPRRLAEIPLWLNTHAYPDEVSNTMARAKALFPNHDVGIHWHLWQHSGHDVNYPEYFPEQPGTRECLAYCRSIGAEAMPYTNGRLWSTNLVSFPLVSHAALTSERGLPYVEQYGTLTPPMSPMCPYTADWDGVLNDFASRVLDLGAGSLFLDQIGACSGRACYHPGHGHPLGGGTWYFDGYQSILAKTHARFAAKGAFLTVEGSGEQWMNVIDGYLQVTQRQTDDVPFFPAVYSGYTTYFCSPENHLDDLDSFWAAQARELAWGQSLGWFHPQILGDAAKCALLRRLTEFRQANLDCLAYGTLEDGLRFPDALPEQKVTWLGRKAFYLWKVKDAPLSPTLEGTLPSAVGFVWRSAKTGRRAAILANLSGAERTVRFDFCGTERTLTLSPRELKRVNEY